MTDKFISRDFTGRGRKADRALKERIPPGQYETIYISGQVSHDDKGNIVGLGNMEVQMRQAYANIHKVLAEYKASMDNLVDEVLFVTDMDAAFAAAVKCRQEVFSVTPVVASTIVQYSASHSPN